MLALFCTGCGSKDLMEQSGLVVCLYCGSRFTPSRADASRHGTVITLESDIEALLEQCRTDPVNRRRLANLILDMDPTNKKAKLYL